MGNLLIAVPTTDYMHGAFVKSLLDLTFQLHRDGVAHEIALEIGTEVCRARERLANKAVNEGFERVLWLDSDMVFQPDILDALEFCGKPFVCGAFQSRRPPYSSCVFKDIRLKSLERVKEYGLAPFKVDGCGFACVLMKTEVIDAIKRKDGECFARLPHYSEDLSFCVRAKAVGYEIWCDPTARAGHLAHIPIWPGEEPAT